MLWGTGFDTAQINQLEFASWLNIGLGCHCDVPSNFREKFQN